MTTPTRTSAAILDEVVSALRRGDRSRAEQALTTGPVDAEGLTRLAELNLRRRRWADAAWLFDRVSEQLPPNLAFKRNLCRNLASLSVHRPDICRLLSSLPPSDAVTVSPSSTGHPTIAVKQSDGAWIALSAANRPLPAAEGALQQLRPAMDKGLAIGLSGLGDGYLLYRLATEDSKLFLGMQVPVFVIEPDPHIALHALMIHDYSGPAGPIEQQRFNWFIGTDWHAQVRDAIAADPFLGLPTVTIGFTDAAPAIRATLATITQEIAHRDSDTQARVEAYYDSYNPAQLQSLLEPTSSRRPRVLLVTTRFSTVLQYATRDAAAAFDRLGWQTHVAIEATPAHRLLRAGLRQVLDAFKPDLVFQIDHLRHEHGNLFPPNLPFACWVQDHLPHLTTPGVGRNVGATEFVLTDTADTYEQKYHYPPRQLLALPKLTRTVDATEGSDDGPDLVFVSNASRPPTQILDGLCTEVEKYPALQQLLRICGQRMIAVYAAGGSLGTYFGHILPLIRQVTIEQKLTLDTAQLDHAARVLFHPLNDALYRQQALAWAADAATELGLRFELYGNGWNQHPRLQSFARGPVAYDALTELTRRAKINLQIVPYLCLHQRLLDGVMAGGFFLIRQHTADVHPGQLLQFAVSHGVADRTNTAEVLSALPCAADRRRFGQLARAARAAMCTTGREDVYRMVRQWHEAGQLAMDGSPLPQFEEVCFDSAANFRDRLERFLNAPSLRRDLARRQRTEISHRLTYEAGLGRIARQIAAKLSVTDFNTSKPAHAVEREAA